MSKVSSGEYKNTLRSDYVNLKQIDSDLFNCLTVMHLFFYVRLLAFLLLNVANKITDGNLLKAKLDIFIEEQGPQVLRFFGRGPRIIKV